MTTNVLVSANKYVDRFTQTNTSFLYACDAAKIRIRKMLARHWYPVGDFAWYDETGCHIAIGFRVYRGRMGLQSSKLVLVATHNGAVGV